MKLIYLATLLVLVGCMKSKQGTCPNTNGFRTSKLNFYMNPTDYAKYGKAAEAAAAYWNNASKIPDLIKVTEVKRNGHDETIFFTDMSVSPSGVNYATIKNHEMVSLNNIYVNTSYAFNDDPDIIPMFNQFDLTTVITHEMGHALGFKHTTDFSDMMHPYLGSGQTRTSIGNETKAMLECSYEVNLWKDLKNF